jgi:hypothetical protein
MGFCLQGCKPLLLLFHIELCDGQMLLGAAAFAALQICVTGGDHMIVEIILEH